ncbi:MAG TPA: hypothetical protein VIY28_03815 [Pseudonocardiaceae bacterium]
MISVEPSGWWTVSSRRFGSMWVARVSVRSARRVLSCLGVEVETTDEVGAATGRLSELGSTPEGVRLPACC